MRQQPLPRLVGSAIAGMALVAGLGACGSSASHVAIPTTTLHPPSTTSTSRPTSTTSVARSSPSVTDQPALPTTSSPATTSAGLPACATDGLTIALTGPTDPGAGSFSYVITFANKGSSACTLSGFPGVSSVSASNSQIGAAAQRTASTGMVIPINPGQSASAVLRVAQAANFPTPACTPVAAAGLRVYPPQETASVILPTTNLQACSGTAVQLQINPMVAGVAAG